MTINQDNVNNSLRLAGRGLTQLLLGATLGLMPIACDDTIDDTQGAEHREGCDGFVNQSFRLRLATFIPCEAVGGPLPILDGYDLFAGDHRGFSSELDASVRASIDVVFGPGHPTVEVEPAVGETHELDADKGTLDYGSFDAWNCPELQGEFVPTSSATASVSESVEFIEELYVVNDDGSGQAKGKLVVDAGNPLTPSWFTPPINHQLEFDISWDEDGSITSARIEGAHDPFPAHEVYLYDDTHYFDVLNYWTCGGHSPEDLICSYANQETYNWSL